MQQLTKERDELDQVFRLAESLENQKRDKEKTGQLQNLIQTKGRVTRSVLRRPSSALDDIQSEIQSEKSLSTDLDAKLREWEKKVRQKQTDSGGAHVSTNFNVNVRKQERALENRLDTVGVECGAMCWLQFDVIVVSWQALKRFNWLLTSNCSLRDEIDNLRNERERFESLSQKLEKELRDLRSELVECIEQSVSSYEIRYVMIRSVVKKKFPR